MLSHKNKIKYIDELLYEAVGWNIFYKPEVENFIKKAKIIIEKIDGSNSEYIKSVDIFARKSVAPIMDDYQAEIIGALEQLKVKIELESDDLEKLDQPVEIKNLTGKIFISHSSKDIDIVRAFTEHILQLGLHIKIEEIFNTSIEDAGIKTGDDFKIKIGKELKTAKAVIQIITKNYKESEVCLNEMGAAWILNIPVIPFILEPISHNTVGFIHSTNQQLKLDSHKDLKKFVSDNKGNLFSEKYDDQKLDRKIDEFLEIIKKEIYNSSIK